MTLAVVDLFEERLKLFYLLLSILQPVLLVALCVLFVIASVHLLTMLSTRWGNRRVSSKALLFSVSLHVALALGILALLPESHHQIWATIASADEPIEVMTTPVMNPETSDGTEGSVSILRQFPRPDDAALARTERVPDDLVSEREVTRPETAASMPEPGQTSYIPPDQRVIPEREKAAETGQTEIAVVAMPVPELPPTEQRTESPVGAAQFTRNSVANPVPGPLEASRPATGGVDSIVDQPNPVVEPQALRLDVGEEAELLRGDDDGVARRTGILAAPVTADPRTGTSVPESSLISGSAPGAPIARTGSLRPDNSMDSSIAVERPHAAVSSVAQGAGRAKSIGGPVSEFVPEQPSLARADAPRSEQRLPAEFTLRTPEQQKRAIQQFGGSPESQAAVDESLRFLAAAQEVDGRWSVRRWEGGSLTKSPDGQPRDFSPADLDVGVTALATLAFLGKGNSLIDGEYSEVVRRSVKWLSDQQHASGFIGRDPRNFRTNTVPGNMAGMYGHGMSTFALAEAYAMSRDVPEGVVLRKRIELAVSFILQSQLDDGGWRYFQYQTQGGDVSLFGWQLMALKSAQIGGIPIPDGAREKMAGFLRASARGDHSGLAAYRKGERITPSMTAEALFCRQVLGIERNSESSREAVSYLLSPQAVPSRQRIDLYYWYYGTLAMKQFGEPQWTEWNVRVRDLLVAEQVREGDLAGSWPPRDPWSGYGGRIYSTAMATLCLEVYFRFLPLYDRVLPGPAPAEPAAP